MYPKIDDPQNYTAALYLRLSKEDDNTNDDSESIKNQRAMLEGYAKSERINIHDVYIDDGISGTSFDRPGFERMIEDIEMKKVNLVITKDMSRLGRDYIDTGHYMERYFPEHGVRYISLLDDIDTGSINYNGDITPFKALLNDMYAKDISKKIKSVKRDKQMKGLFIGGKAPYGYKKSPEEKNVIVIDEPAAENVRYIFKLALEGKSCRQIAMVLNEQNIPTPATYANIKVTRRGPYSGKWSSERISDMLQNQVYLGYMVQGRVQKVSYKSKKLRKLPRDQWTVVEGTHEAIIDRQTFEKVSMFIKSRNQTRSRTHDYLLKGIIFCHECQHPLGVVNRTLADNRQMLYFICRTYQRFTKYDTCTCHCVREKDVSAAVLNKVHQICKNYLDTLNFDELTDEATKRIQAVRQRQGNDIFEMKGQLEAIEAKIERAYDDRLEGIINETLFQKTQKRLNKDLANLQQKINLLEHNDSDDLLLDKEKVKELTIRFFNSKEYSREFIVSLIERIELTQNKEILIYFRFKELNLTHRLQ